MHASRCLSLAVLLAIPSLAAQTPAAKRVLTQSDWDQWRSITGAAISNDGRWAVYTLLPQVGDGELPPAAPAKLSQWDPTLLPASSPPTVVSWLPPRS